VAEEPRVSSGPGQHIAEQQAAGHTVVESVKELKKSRQEPLPAPAEPPLPQKE
jgi:hypothetical protein